MNRYTFKTNNVELSQRNGKPDRTIVEAPDEATARHRAMVARWGQPGFQRAPFSSEPNRYYGLGLQLEDVQPLA